MKIGAPLSTSGLENLDYYFPFFLLLYGILLVFMIQSQALHQTRGSVYSRLFSGSLLPQVPSVIWASVVLIFSSLWCLQNIWFYS
jgi:hypothetical protein